MRTIKLLGVSVLALGLAVGSAVAADPPIFDEPIDDAYDWTGFYVGVHGGAGVVQYTGTVGVTASWNATGFLAGASAGYNWQNDNYVVGFDVTADWVGMSGTVNPVLAAGTSQTRWQAFLRGKAGIAQDNWLIYGAAGLGVHNNDINVGAIPPINNTHLAATAGVGFTYAFDNGVRFNTEANVVITDQRNYNPSNVWLIIAYTLAGIEVPF